MKYFPANFKFLATIVVRNPRNPNIWIHKCNGVIIGKSEVVTAAQCVYYYGDESIWYVLPRLSKLHLIKSRKRMKKMRST